MAWTAPKTDFAPGNILNAAQMNAIGENLDAIGGPWTAFTPTWTNVTLGTGPTHESAYMNAGNLYIVRYSLTLGTGGALTGAPQASLPAGASFDGQYSDFMRIGWGSFVDASPVSAFICHMSPVSGDFSKVQFNLNNTAGTYLTGAVASATVPWTWASGDQIMGQTVFEAA
jgi:hypothetical protein